MKKNLFYLGMLLVATLMINGCDSSDDVKANYIEYNGKSHSIKDAGQVFFGHYFGNNSNNITLLFITDEHNVTFEMFVPNGDTKLLTGNYLPNDNYQPFTILNGLITKDGNTVYSMTTATIKIKVDGNVYNIEIEGTLQNNTTVKGKFSGQLEWLDES